MKFFIYIGMALFLAMFVHSVCGAATRADAPVYAKRTLSVPAVILEEDNTVAGNVTLEMQDNGQWILKTARLLSLAHIDKAEVELSTQGDATVAQLKVQGYLADGCTSMGDVIEARYGDTFHVAITTVRPDSEICTMQVIPFEKTIPLDITGLAPGRYRVRVNETETWFELGQDDEIVCCRSYCCTCAPEYRDQYKYEMVPRSSCRRPADIVGGNCYQVVDDSMCRQAETE